MNSPKKSTINGNTFPHNCATFLSVSNHRSAVLHENKKWTKKTAQLLDCIESLRYFAQRCCDVGPGTSQEEGGSLGGMSGLTCSLSIDRERVLNSLENTQKATIKNLKIEQLEYQRYLVF